VLIAYAKETTGQTMILQFNQKLWYFNRRNMTLWHHDPTDSTRDFGISGDAFVKPFEMKGTTIFFKLELPNHRVY
jgi:hypothetical protein